MSAKNQNVALAANDLAPGPAPSLETLQARALEMLETVAKDVKENLAITRSVATAVAGLVEAKLAGTALAEDKKRHAALKRRFGTDRFDLTYPKWVEKGRPTEPQA